MSGIRDLVLEQIKRAPWCESVEAIDDDDIGVEAQDGDLMIVTVRLP